MKKILSFALVLPLVISLFSCQILPGTGTPDDPDNPAPPAKDDTETPKEKDEAGTAVAFVTVDINHPSRSPLMKTVWLPVFTVLTRTVRSSFTEK